MTVEERARQLLQHEEKKYASLIQEAEQEPVWRIAAEARNHADKVKERIDLIKEILGI